MEQPDEVHLSRQDGEALIKRLQGDALTAQDRRVLEQVLRWYFWLLFALQEARFSLKRLRAMVCGDRTKQRPQQPSAGGVSAQREDAGGSGATPAAAPESRADHTSMPPSSGERRSGHGRQGAQAYSGAVHVVCRHETLAVGERCPVCGRGRLYRVTPGVEVRLDGHALLSAVRYGLEKLRCSACGQVFTAAVPAEAGTEKYSARARAVLVVGRYYLGVPLYRLEGYQAMGGVPVSDATQWDQIERVADCAYPGFEHLQALAAQGEVSYQDDTHVRILSLLAANREAQADGPTGTRTGMYTTALVAQQGAQTICLYFAGRAHAGENLEAL
jgi:transposase